VKFQRSADENHRFAVGSMGNVGKRRNHVAGAGVAVRIYISKLIESVGVRARLIWPQNNKGEM
jgi:hypothetical protein